MNSYEIDGFTRERSRTIQKIEYIEMYSDDDSGIPNRIDVDQMEQTLRAELRHQEPNNTAHDESSPNIRVRMHNNQPFPNQEENTQQTKRIRSSESQSNQRFAQSLISQTDTNDSDGLLQRLTQRVLENSFELAQQTQLTTEMIESKVELVLDDMRKTYDLVPKSSGYGKEILGPYRAGRSHPRSTHGNSVMNKRSDEHSAPLEMPQEPRPNTATTAPFGSQMIDDETQPFDMSYSDSSRSTPEYLPKLMQLCVTQLGVTQDPVNIFEGSGKNIFS